MIKQTLALPATHLVASLKEVNNQFNHHQGLYTFKLGDEIYEARYHLTDVDLWALADWIKETVK